MIIKSVRGTPVITLGFCCIHGAAALMASCLNLVFFTSAAAAVLPEEIGGALARAQIPREALVAVVQEVGSANNGNRPAARLDWQADRGVNPASLTKLLTTYAALDRLGPAWSWSTPVWLQGTIQQGELQGDVIIKGSGDPKLVLERIQLLLRRVRQMGVREIRGDIVLDRRSFEASEQSGPNFDGESGRPYNATADALLLNYKSLLINFTPDPTHGVARVSVDPTLAGMRAQATVPLSAGVCGDWRSALKADLSEPLRVKFQGAYVSSCGEKFWPVAYAVPKNYNEQVLTGLWQEMGGTLKGRVRDGIAPGKDIPPSFEFASPPLAEVVRDINKYSNNVMAQQLFLTLGLMQRGKGSPDAAREVLRDWLSEQLGPEAAASIVIDNGSGLSRQTRISAHQLSRLLQNAWASPVMPELMSSLPIAGLDGTLKRNRGSAISGQAHLKTGSLRDVSGIAGYVLAANGRRYVVVGIVNHANAASAKPALDALVKWAAGVTVSP
jgi:serine-type D-Ala-D-Ala carboxypeptidase/endopeptidase (penicillin-binding protein 4)